MALPNLQTIDAGRTALDRYRARTGLSGVSGQLLVVASVGGEPQGLGPLSVYARVVSYVSGGSGAGAVGRVEEVDVVSGETSQSLNSLRIKKEALRLVAC